MSQDIRNNTNGSRVRLRALEPSDADLLYVWENDPATWEAGDRRWPVSLSDIRTFVEHTDLDIWQTRQTRFMIDRQSDGVTVGCIDIFGFDPLNMTCSIGVLVQPESRNAGYAADALRQIEGFAADTLLVHTIIVTVAADNAPSLALFDSAGYERAGLLRQKLRRGKVYVDEVLMQKIL